MVETSELRELDRMLRSIPGARTEARTLVEVLEREVACLVDARSPAAAILLGNGDARDAIAKFQGSRAGTMPCAAARSSTPTSRRRRTRSSTATRPPFARS